MFVETLTPASIIITDERPSLDPILMTALIDTSSVKPPMLVKIAPGINIASLSSAVDMDPMMRSGKPMVNKAIPTTMAATALLLEDEGSAGSAGLTLKSLRA